MVKIMFNIKNQILSILVFTSLMAFMSSCTGDLSTTPLDNDVQTSVSVYETQGDYEQVLAKLYAGLALTGQSGGSGAPDIQSDDEGFSNYMRQLFAAQVVSTDEVVVAWDNPNFQPYNFQSWSASNSFVFMMYSRVYYEIALANEFIRNAKGNNDPTIQTYNAEARFLRALSYWHALDLYGGGVPFVTENDGVGAYNPPSISSDSLFNYIENELLAIEDQLSAPGQGEYGRANRAAAWTLLTKLYLNAEVYIGEPHYTEAITYAKRVIDQGGYQLEDNYQDLFLADNHTANGIIFAVPSDGENMQSYGNTNYIIHASVGGNMSASNFGIDGPWAGNRVTPEFVNKFDLDNDSRAMFFTDGQTLDIEDPINFQHGYAVTKWQNITSNGEPGSRPAFVDTDFPMFRLADVYLMYAEAIERGGQGGDNSEALSLVNDIRERAYGDASGNITSSELDLEFLINERARELYWENHRRTDLIRFGMFTGSDYIWSWKGEQKDGTATDAIYNLYPIPSSDINANPNLTQNPGY
ncbi:RagB/SusD family nutrient uptake outer membrane protein [Aliifodinibius salipaludis]|uniref:RagB/SusD family nutrient uptake outer membrane protein n=2 Tax=Fodinibius salipaludis TaxID=2032627 RepID=A0A2A2GFF4_9BACT|nr:RagB/SusD family nutrient uptake outer membrane protein [Aliifodinibius salipaludis]